MDYKTARNELGENNKRIFGSTGATGSDFLKFHDSALADDALDKKTKELMSLGIAIAIRCEGCIVSHVNSCIKLGATMAEITDTVEVAMLMSGGPGVVYGGKALACAEEFFAEQG